MNIISGVSIKGISCAVPKQHLSLLEYAPDLLTEKTAKRLTKSAGFSSLRIAPEDIAASDLVVASAEPLLRETHGDDIGAIVFVSKTQDYIEPATSHLLQDRLRLSNKVLCLDINEGCSGWVKGLYTSALLSRQMNKSVLLADGDTTSRLTSPKDRATRCIFGDAGTVTLIAPNQPETSRMSFEFESLGESHDAIITQGLKGRKTEELKNDGFMYMDGIAVLNFSLNDVPELIQSFLAELDLTVDEVSLFACHQAGKKILNSLADKLGVSYERLPFVAGEIGNVSSASIPLMLTLCADKARLDRVLCCGFGVGLSIGVGMIDFSDTKFYGVMEVE